MSIPWVRRRLILLMSLLAAVGLLTALPVSPLGHVPAAYAATAGDLVFAQEVGTTGNYHLTYLRTSTGAETQLTSLNSDLASTPNVSGNGSKIVFQDTQYASNGDGGQGTWAMNSDGSGLTQLTFPNINTANTSAASYFWDSTPVWSPDGTKIAFQRQTYNANVPGGGQYRIFTMNADGTNVQDLTPNDDFDYNPVWSPNGSKIAYVGSDQLVHVMNADGSSDHVVDPSTDCSGGTYPQWTSTNTIYVLVGCNSNHLAKITSTDGFATLANSTETDLDTVTTGTAADLSMSSDGSIAYYDSQSGGTYAMTVSTGNATLQGASSESNGWPAAVNASWSIKHFAQLGDSYSSGEGNPPFISGTDTSSDKCHRSNAAYAKVLDSHPDGLSLSAFVACSGATTSDVINGKNGESSQLSSISSSDNYVILTIGGNDVQFAQFATNCVTGNCDGSTQYNTTEGLIQNTLPGNLDTLFSDIKADVGSNTRVLVLGYPYILPLSSQTGINCTYLTSGERTAATNVQVDLDGAIHSAVTRAGSPFEYVDANPTGGPFDGHQLCASGSYFNGLDLTNTVYSFHPNADGHTAYAKVVTNYLAAHP